MPRSRRYNDFLELRKKYPFFSFEKQEYTLTDDGLHVKFTFNLSDRYFFHPTLFIPAKNGFLPGEHLSGNLDNIVFHIGLIELISYWKAACSPLVIIKPFYLKEEQIAWWKKLWFNGLGEFFYLNGIATTPEEFMKVEIRSETRPFRSPLPTRDEILIPVGGGKDSAVTLQLLGDQPGSLPLILNPRGASIETIKAAGFANGRFLEIRRTLDPVLLQLNGEGYLNGHTPFSALLAFVTLLAAMITGKRYIALSNESSANEPTLPGTTINHQYSKTVGFEGDFRDYVKEYLTTDHEYFSFLRPLNELQIAAIFSKYPSYFPVFKSCNAGSKTDCWCGACPKCLFTSLILAPFISRQDRFGIFGKELFDDPDLMPVLDQLTGIADEKPFDCVGTIGEVNLALCETIRQYGNDPLPMLLACYRETGLFERYRELSFNKFLNNMSDNHFIPGRLLKILKTEMNHLTPPSC